MDFIFYHIEKCGGTSMRYILYNYFLNFYDKNNIYLPENNNNINLKDDNKAYLMEKLLNQNVKILLVHVRYGDFPLIDDNTSFKF